MRARVSVIFALAAALACSRPALNLGEGCQINSECADPLVCVLGSCRRQCLDTRDCGAGLLCIVTSAELGGGCQLREEMSCTLTSECHAPLVCQNGTCTTVCLEDRDCAAGAHCTTDSAGLHACYDTAVQPCVYNSDCPDPMICDDEQRCRLECVGDRDCISPRVCAGSLCVLPGAGDGGT